MPPASLITAHFEQHQQVVQASLERLGQPASSAASTLVEALQQGKKVITFGNGGSAAQASHLVAELMGKFRHPRHPLPALALTTDPATFTCISNDFGFETVFERQVRALAEPGDVAVGFTTSGKSPNVLRGFAEAKRQQAITIALTGKDGLYDLQTDHQLAVPSTDTALIQEIHLLLLHAWCACIDAAFVQMAIVAAEATRR